jgi:hypothetical protein
MRGTCLIWTANPNKIRGVVSPATEITKGRSYRLFPNFKQPFTYERRCCRIRELIINVNSLDDLANVRRVIDAHSLGCVVTSTGDDCWVINTQHELAVRLVRLYNQLTGRSAQYMGFPCVLMYSNL